MDAVEDFVGRVARPDDPDVDDGTTGEGDGLPRPTGDLAPVADHVPVLVVPRHLDVVRVRTVVTVPQQQPIVISRRI